jgi:hypothetical protein
MMPCWGVWDLRIAKVLGIRPGEAFDCLYAKEMAGGCGTSRYCVTCGAAVAIVSCLGETGRSSRNAPCRRDKRASARYLFPGQASPLDIGSERVILLFLQDITAQERWAALERMFFNDIGNTISAIHAAAATALTAKQHRRQESIHVVHRLAERLAREFALQKALTHQDIGEMLVAPSPVYRSRFYANCWILRIAIRPVSAGLSVSTGLPLPAGFIPTARSSPGF